MSEDMKIGAMVFSGFIFFFLTVATVAVVDQEQKLRCLHDNLARPALEAKILCGGIK